MKEATSRIDKLKLKNSVSSNVHLWYCGQGNNTQIEISTMFPLKE